LIFFRRYAEAPRRDLQNTNSAAHTSLQTC
jgi:hypothetical protein